MKKNYIFFWVLIAALLIPNLLTAQNRVLDEGFDNTVAGSLPPDWTQEPSTGPNKWAVETGNFNFPSGTFSGAGRVKFSSGISPQKVKLISPAFDITPFDNPILVFSYASVPYPNGPADSLKVYYRYSSTSAWMLAKSYGASDEWLTDTIDFASKTRNFQIAFEGIDKSGHGVAVDRVIVTQRAACKPVAGVNLFGITDSGANMTWQGSLANRYIVKLSATALANPATDAALRVDTVNYQTNHQYSGLTPSTQYYYYIQTDCGLGDISTWTSGIFKTACPPVATLATSFDEPGDIECWKMTAQAFGEYFAVPPTNVTVDVQAYGGTFAQSPSPRTGASSLLFNVNTRGLTEYSKVYAVSPRLADTIDLSTKQLDFWIKANGDKLKLHVMISEFADDFSDAQSAGVISVKTTGSYEHIIVTFENLQSTGRYIVLYADGSETLSTSPQFPMINVDDLELKPLDLCSPSTKVGMFSEPAITGATALLKWNGTGAAQWRVKVATSSINPATGTASVADRVVSTPEITLSQLSAGSTYFYYVQTICASGVTGAWSNEQKFQTDCAVEGINLPYIENFDKYAKSTMPQCWSYKLVGGSGGQVPSVESSNYSASTPMYLYIYNLDQTAYVVTPKINADLSTVQVSLKLSISAIQVPITIGIMTDPNDDSTFEPLATYTVTTAGTYNNFNWVSKKLLLNTYTGQGKYIAFKYTGNTEYKIDDLVIETINDCLTPEDLTVTGTTGSTVTLDWTPTAAGETAWEIAYGAQGFQLTENTPVTAAPTHPFTVSGLTENATYEFYLRSSCSSSSKGSWFGPVSAKTVSPATVPYFTDFEDVSAAGAWNFANGTQINQWIIGGGASDNNNGKALYISDSYGATNTFSAGQSFNYAYRTFDLSAGVYDFGFKWRLEGIHKAEVINPIYGPGWFNPPIIGYDTIMQTFYNDYLSAYLVPAEVTFQGGANSTGSSAYDFREATYVPSGWIALSPKNLVDSTAAWHQYSTSLQLNTAGKYNLVFFWQTYDNVDNSKLAGAIDDVSVSVNTSLCVTPENLKVSEITQTTAKLSFASHNATNWTLKISENQLAETAIDTATIHSGVVQVENITSNPYSITGLETDVSYYVYLKANCGGGWAEATFRTICNPVGVPLAENFDSYPSTPTSGVNTNFPACWRRIYTGGTTAYPYVFGPYMYGTTGVGDNLTKSLAFIGSSYSSAQTFAISPELIPDVKALQIKFRYAIKYDNTNPFKLAVGVMNDPYDKDSFVGIDTVSITTGDKWNSATILFDEYTGAGKHIALQMFDANSNSSLMYVDDIVIDSIKGCVSPKEITVSNISTTSADISWRVLGEALSYRVKVSSVAQTRWEDEGDIYDAVISGTSTQLSNLNANTPYYVYVRTDCGDGTYSLKYSEATFRTACLPLSVLPFKEDFESYDLAAFPDCWIAVENPAYGGSHVIALNGVTPDEKRVKSFGEKSFVLLSNTQIGSMIATPEIDINSLSNLRVRFQAMQTLNNDLLYVGAISDPSDISTFVGIDTLNLTRTNEWFLQDIDFSAYNGNAKHIAFYMKSGTMSGQVYYIDDLDIRDKTVTCPDITSVIVTQLRDTSTSISWAENPNALSYEYKVSGRAINPETTEGDVIPVTVTYDNFANMSGLDPQTTYYAYVRSACSGNAKGYWSDALKFTTLCSDSLAIPYVENFDAYGEIGENSYFPECWTYSTTSTGTAQQIVPYINKGETALVLEPVFDDRDSSYSAVTVTTPRIAVSDTINTYQLRFKMKAAHAGTVFYVGFMTDPANTSTFVPYDTITVATYANSWEEKMLNLRFYDGKAQHLAFRADGADARTVNPGKIYGDGSGSRGGWTIYIDSLKLWPLDDCMAPYKARVDARPAKAFVSWLPGDVNNSEWTYYYSNSSYYSLSSSTTAAEMEEWFENNIYAAVNEKGFTTQPRATINDLDKTNSWGGSITTYYVYLVNSICGKVYPAEIVINRPSCTSIDAVPYSEDFSRHGFGAADTIFSAFPDCWSRGDDYPADNISYPYIEADSSLYFYSAAGAYSYAALPETSVDLTKHRVLFSAKAAGLTDSLFVGIMTDAADVSTFEALDTIVPGTSWSSQEVRFENYAGTGSYVAFLSATTNAENKVYIDNLVFDATPYCFAPDVQLANRTTSSFEIQWTKGEGQTKWDVVYGLKGIDPDASTPVQRTEEKYSASNLTPNTQYDVYVRSYCSNGLTSDWIKLSVVTFQNAASYPYSTDFASGEAGNWTLENGTETNGWIIGQATGTPATPALYISNDGTNYGYDIESASDVFAYRTINIPAGPQKLSFYWKTGGEVGTDFLRVFLVPQLVSLNGGNNYGITSTDTPEGWTSVGDIELSNNTSWTKSNFDVYVSDENTEPLNLVFYWTNNDNGGNGIPAAIDSINFKASDFCTTPEKLVARQITPTSAVLNWVSYNASQWNVKITAEPQSDPETASGVVEVANTKPFTIGNLQPDSTYYVYVQSTCDPSWSAGISFTTLCAPVTVLDEEFAEVPASCWGLYEGLATEVFTTPASLVESNSGWTTTDVAVLEGTHAKLNIASAQTKFWLVSPAITLTQNSALSFDLALTGANTIAPISNATGQADDQFAVLVSADAGATWKAEDAVIWNNKGTGNFSFNKIATLGEKVDVDLFKYTGQTVRIAFYGESTVELESNDIHIDNALIECREKQTFNGEVCQGYRYQAHGFNIAPENTGTTGLFTYTRVVPSTTGGCDTTYVLNLTVKETKYIDRTAVICSNQTYNDADFSGLNTAGVHYSTPKTGVNGCDSIIVLTLTVNQAYNVVRYLELTSDQLPYPYACSEIPADAKPGIREIACTTVAGCDSIITLHLTIDGNSGLSDIGSENLLSLSPSPSKRGEVVNVNYEFTAPERDGLKVEVFNSIGVCVRSIQPVNYPVSMDGFNTSGVYLVRITTGTNKIMFGKFVVQ